MPDETEIKLKAPEPKISVEYGADLRKGRTFHITGPSGATITLSQKEARMVAEAILKISKVEK